MKQTRYFTLLLLLLSFFVLSVTSFAQDEPEPEPEDPALPQFGDNYYDAVVSEGLTWDEANTAASQAELPENCTSSHLVVITSEEENQFLIDTFGEEVLANKWLGAFQAEDATEVDLGWEWVTGEEWLFTAWAELEPNDSPDTVDLEDGEENHLEWHQDGGGWNDDAADNTDSTGYIIEFECEPPANVPPVVEDFEVQTNEDESIAFHFIEDGHAYDPDDQPGPLTIIVDTDPAVGTLTVSEDGAASFTPDAEWSGTTSFTYHANDGELDSLEIATVTIIVMPVNDPPNCDALTTDVSIIWPPNHKMVPVAIDDSSVSDIDSTEFDVNLTDISSDEPENGLGDGDTAPDWNLEDGTVRAERSGLGDGRTYTISASVDDLDWIDTFEDLEGIFESTPDPIDGGDCEGSAAVDVPHDMGGGNDASEEAPAEEPTEEAAPNLPETANENAQANANENAGKGNNNAGGNSDNANSNNGKGNDNANDNAAVANDPADNGNGNSENANENAGKGNNNGKSNK